MINLSPLDLIPMAGAANIPLPSTTRPVGRQSPSVDQDVVGAQFYTFGMTANVVHYYRATTGGGIIEFYVDGVMVDTWDSYNAGGTIDLIRTTAGIAFAAGNHLLTWKVNGKNGASGGYRADHGATEIVPV